MITKFLFILLFSTPAYTAPNTPGVIQRNAGDSTTINRFMPVPASNALFFFNTTTLLPEMVTLGSGLSYSSGVISATGGGFQVNSDWNSVSGVTQILNKPTLSTVATSGNYVDLTNRPSLASVATTGSYSSLTGAPTVVSAFTNDVGYVTTSSLSATLGSYVTGSGLTSTLGSYVTSASLSSSLGNYVLTSALSSYVTTSALSSTLASYATTSALTPYLTSSTAASTYATQSSVTSGLSTKYNTPTGTTAQYVRGDGSVATLPTQTAFNFSQPAARTLAVSTSYQATDLSKAAIITPSYACQNATQVLASSACTLQVRMGTGTLTCSTGQVVYTQSLTVALGVLLTQNSTNPVQINLPIGASFILCPSAGTFTITAVEQSAG